MRQPYPRTSHPHASGGMRNALLAAGALLAGAALAVRWKTRQAERDNPPHGSFVTVEGVRLHYVDRGQGQPVVLLHGNGSMAADFELSGVVDLAATSYRVIAFDRPGYGYSERPRGTVWTPAAQADLIVKALAQLGIEQPVVVGHSWGTMVAVAMGLHHPEAVRSLVLLSGYYYPTPRLDAPLLAVPAIPVLGTLMRHTVSPLFGRLIWPKLVQKLFSPAAVPPSFQRFPAWMALRPSQLRASAAESGLMVPAAFSMRKQYHDLTMPVVILAGEDDAIVNTDIQSARLHEDLPHSEMHRIPGDGHMIHHLVPYEVMSAIDTAATAA